LVGKEITLVVWEVKSKKSLSFSLELEETKKKKLRKYFPLCMNVYCYFDDYVKIFNMNVIVCSGLGNWPSNIVRKNKLTLSAYYTYTFFSKHRQIANYQLKQKNERNLELQEQKEKNIDFERSLLNRLKEKYKLYYLIIV